MMSSDFVIEVSEADFEYEVLAYSQQAPVVVDFWAEWCGPCKLIGPVLERLAQEAQGAFRLAKVNVDENPNLAMQYAIRSIPSVKAFQDGRVVAEFVGAQPEPRIREFIKQLAPNEDHLLTEKGFGQLQMGRAKQAEETFREVLDQSPDTPKALLGLAKSLLYQGNAEESLWILRNFPDSPEYHAASMLLPLAQALREQENQRDEPDLDLDPLAGVYQRSLALVRRSNIPAALDGMLDILREEKRYRNGAAHKAVVGLLELLGDENPETDQYRKELASILF